MGSILLVNIDDFFDSIARYLTALWLIKHFPSAFPYKTFTKNILGWLLIEIVFGFGQSFEWLASELRFFIAIGFCSVFTILSPFTLKNIISPKNSNYLTLSTL